MNKRNSKYTKLIEWLGAKEKAVTFRDKKNGLYAMKSGQDLLAQAALFRAVDNLSYIIDERISKNLSTIQNESDMLANSDIMQKLKMAVMGKFKFALQILRDHNFKCKMNETLSDEIMKRLMDRLMKSLTSSNVDLKKQGYDRLRKNFLFENRKKSVCKRILDSNFRLLAAGFNKLVQDSRAKAEAMQNKLKFIIAALRDSDLNLIGMAYFGLKRNKDMINGVG